MEYVISKTIKQYDFWDYSLNEALFLFKKEEATTISIIQNMRQEYYSNVDKFSKQIITSHIEGLLIIPKGLTIVNSLSGLFQQQ